MYIHIYIYTHTNSHYYAYTIVNDLCSYCFIYLLLFYFKNRYSDYHIKQYNNLIETVYICKYSQASDTKVKLCTMFLDYYCTV